MKPTGLLAGLTAVLGAALAGILIYMNLFGTGQTYMEAETAGEKEPQVLVQETQESSLPPETTQIPQTEESRPSLPEDPVRLLFGGDVLLSDHVLGAYSQAGTIEGVVDAAYLQEIEAADLFAVNQEFPFSSRGTPAPDKQFTFRLPPEKVSMFQEMGIDLVTLANNHALDYGTDALVDTLDTLDGAGILHVGAGRNLDQAKAPVYIQIKGETIGFLGASRVIPEVSWNAGEDKPGMLVSYDPSMTLEQIRQAREACDYLVVFIHWGIERDEFPQEYQREMGRQFIDAGADLVVGIHPHVLQGIEYYNGKPILYSLGNFVFGSSIPRTALLKVEWDGSQAALSLIPGTSSAGYTRTLTDPEKRQEFGDYMTSLSYGVRVDAQGQVQVQTEEE